MNPIDKAVEALKEKMRVELTPWERQWIERNIFPLLTAYDSALRAKLTEEVEGLKIHEDNEHPQCKTFWEKGLSSGAEMLGNNQAVEDVLTIIKKHE